MYDSLYLSGSNCFNANANRLAEKNFCVSPARCGSDLRTDREQVICNCFCGRHDMKDNLKNEKLVSKFLILFFVFLQA